MNTAPRPIFRQAVVTPKSVGYTMQPGIAIAPTTLPQGGNFGGSYSPTQPGAPVFKQPVMTGGPAKGVSSFNTQNTTATVPPSQPIQPILTVTPGGGGSAPVTDSIAIPGGGSASYGTVPVTVAAGGFNAPSQLMGVAHNAYAPSTLIPMDTPTTYATYTGPVQSNQNNTLQSRAPSGAVSTITKGLFS